MGLDADLKFFPVLCAAPAQQDCDVSLALRVAARHAMHAGAKQANARTTAQRVQPGHLIAAAHLDIVAALERTSALGLSTSLGEPDRNSHRTSPARCPGGQEQAQRWPVLRTSRARVRAGLQPAVCPWVWCPSLSAEAEGKTRQVPKNSGFFSVLVVEF